MHRKCYPLTNGTLSGNIGASWHTIEKMQDNVYLMGKKDFLGCAPLYIHSFGLADLKHGQKFMEKGYQCLGDIKTVPEKLKWCRARLGLTQMDVAQQVGIKYWVYHDMENGGVSYSLDVLKKIAKLYQIPVTELLDEYNLFLYRNPPALIREYRNKTGMNRTQFAKKMGMHISCLRDWENGRKQISRKSWEKYFKIQWNAICCKE